MDGTVRVWDPVTGQCGEIFTLSDQMAVRSVSWDADSIFLAASGDNCSVSIWDLTLGGCVATLQRQ
eukprot:12053154-Prorocentrum_lima.AAC.1